jgi:hypothetical protein
MISSRQDKDVNGQFTEFIIEYIFEENQRRIKTDERIR